MFRESSLLLCPFCGVILEKWVFPNFLTPSCVKWGRRYCEDIIKEGTKHKTSIRECNLNIWVNRDYFHNSGDNIKLCVKPPLILL
jgi:hypothetical protein